MKSFYTTLLALMLPAALLATGPGDNHPDDAPPSLRCNGKSCRKKNHCNKNNYKGGAQKTKSQAQKGDATS